jgi:hypothetical protein
MAEPEQHPLLVHPHPLPGMTVDIATVLLVTPLRIDLLGPRWTDWNVPFQSLSW